MNSNTPRLEWHLDGSSSEGSFELGEDVISLATSSASHPRLPLLLVRAGEPHDYVVSNQNPRQPLLVNGQQVRQSALRHGDVLKIGQAELVYDSPLPMRPNSSPLTARTVLGALICSVLLFGLLMPYLTHQLAGLGGTGAGVGTGASTLAQGEGGGQTNGMPGAAGTGSGAGTASGQSPGSGSSGPPSTGTSPTGTSGSNSGAGTPGTGPQPQQVATPPAAQSSNATAASAAPPSPGNTQTGQPQPMPVQPGAAPAPKIVRAIGQIATFSSSGRSIPWTGGNPFQGYENAKSVVFVVDRSSSMSGGKLDATKAHLFGQLPKQKLGGQFSIIYFNTSHEVLPGGLQSLSKSNIDNAKQWSDGVPPNGGTDPFSAIQEALGMKPEVIWILSDGGFSDTIVYAIKQANQSNTVISTVGFFDDPMTLKQIAEQNRGTYRFISR